MDWHRCSSLSESALSLSSPSSRSKCTRNLSDSENSPTRFRANIIISFSVWSPNGSCDEFVDSRLRTYPFCDFLRSKLFVSAPCEVQSLHVLFPWPIILPHDGFVDSTLRTYPFCDFLRSKLVISATWDGQPLHESLSLSMIETPTGTESVSVSELSSFSSDSRNSNDSLMISDSREEYVFAGIDCSTSAKAGFPKAHSIPDLNTSSSSPELRNSKVSLMNCDSRDECFGGERTSHDSVLFTRSSATRLVTISSVVSSSIVRKLKVSLTNCDSLEE